MIRVCFWHALYGCALLRDFYARNTVFRRKNDMPGGIKDDEW